MEKLIIEHHPPGKEREKKKEITCLFDGSKELLGLQRADEKEILELRKAELSGDRIQADLQQKVKPLLPIKTQISVYNSSASQQPEALHWSGIEGAYFDTPISNGGVSFSKSPISRREKEKDQKQR